MSRAQGIFWLQSDNYNYVYCDFFASIFDCDALLASSAADVRCFALPEASVEGGGWGGGSSLVEPSAVIVQVSAKHSCNCIEGR
jgi:hypothetical protein